MPALRAIARWSTLTEAEQAEVEADDPYLLLRRIVGVNGRTVKHLAKRRPVSVEGGELRDGFGTLPVDPIPRLLTVNPDFAGDGDEDPEPAVDVYAERIARGYHWRNPEDTWIEDQPRYGTIIHTLSGGAHKDCPEFGRLVYQGVKRRAA